MIRTYHLLSCDGPKCGQSIAAGAIPLLRRMASQVGWTRMRPRPNESLHDFCPACAKKALKRRTPPKEPKIGKESR